MKSIKTLLFISLIAMACNHHAPESLPFYTGADFTPQWISSHDKALDTLHRVAPFAFLNQDGKLVTSKDLDGKIYVANFFFTTCGSICPRMMANLKTIDSSFANNNRVRLLSYTVLPEADSVPQLNAYARKRNINSRQWWLLTGARQDIYKLARQSYFVDDSLGYNPGDADFLHTENCVLVDGKGYLRGVYNATLPLEMEQLARHIKLLLQEP